MLVPKLVYCEYLSSNRLQLNCAYNNQ